MLELHTVLCHVGNRWAQGGLCCVDCMRAGHRRLTMYTNSELWKLSSNARSESIVLLPAACDGAAEGCGLGRTWRLVQSVTSLTSATGSSFTRAAAASQRFACSPAAGYGRKQYARENECCSTGSRAFMSRQHVNAGAGTHRVDFCQAPEALENLQRSMVVTHRIRARTHPTKRHGGN